MNVAHCERLCRIIAGIVPAQRFEPETPALWAGVLRDIRIEDALEAARRVPRRDGYIDPNDIVAEVRTIRDERLAAASIDTITPNVDPDSVAAYRLELRAIRTGIGDESLDVDAYLAGGFTLTGAPPMRALGYHEEGRKLDLDAVFASVTPLRSGDA